MSTIPRHGNWTRALSKQGAQTGKWQQKGLTLVLTVVFWTLSIDTWAGGRGQEGRQSVPDAARAWYRAARTWKLGDWSDAGRSAPDHLWLVFHGDIPKYYRRQTAADRRELERRLRARRESALLVYPIAAHKDWGGARSMSQSLSLGEATFALIEALSASYGNPGWAVQTFTFSGSGRVDLALQRFFLAYQQARASHSALSARVREFVDERLVAMNAGDAMVSRSMEHPLDIPRSWIRFLETYPHIAAAFIHDVSAEYPYMFGLSVGIGEAFDPDFGLRPGESRSIANGRLRFWGGETHRRAWIGQFGRTLLPAQLGTGAVR